MEADRKPSLRPKRKPLSDCTNILPTTRKNPQLSSSSKIPKSQTLIKPEKHSNFINNKLNPQISSSPKSYTSTGSNNSPNSLTLPSIPRSLDPPAPPTPLSDADVKKSRLSGNSSQRHDGATRKDKGKMVADTPIIQLSASLTSKPVRISSSTAPGQCSRSDIQVTQSQNLPTQTVKDTEKITSDASWVSKYLHMSPSVSSGSFSEAPAVSSQKLHEEKRKDKGKMVLETPDIEASEPSTPHTPLVSPTASDVKKSGLSGNSSQRHDGATRKDKGKMVADTPIIQLSASLTSKPLRISSTAPGHCSRSDIQVTQSQNLPTQTVKDTEKITSDASWVSKYLHMSPSVSSGSFSEAPAVSSQKLHEEKRKDKGKMVLETPDIEASEPSTPHAPLVSPTASGTRERPVTVYNQRRARQGNKHAAGNMNVLFSCPPPDQRIKRKGSVLGYDRGKNKSGSHTDPIPVHKKKRSRDKYGGGAMHVMPKEEVEKLRAYYADIDSFELPEEVASESEIE